jgi:hypothetical protein
MMGAGNLLPQLLLTMFRPFDYRRLFTLRLFGILSDDMIRGFYGWLLSASWCCIGICLWDRMETEGGLERQGAMGKFNFGALLLCW